MKLSSIKIEKFRHIDREIKFTFGEKLTAIIGKNGIGKSSLLGLIGHVCSAPTNDKTIDNKQFETKYSDIFSFSYPKYDKPGQHQYEIEFWDLKGTSTFAHVASYDRKEAGQSNGLRLRVSSFDESNGIKTRVLQRKVKFPVIYLGLKRLFPLVQENSSEKVRAGLSKDDYQFYIDSYNQIMSTEENITPERIISRTKNFIAVQTDTYDVYGNSAGQDNLGQIISAIISFRTLKKSLGKDYAGGLLLIDELDATMFPGALFKLLTFLLKQAGELSLQVVFTSHSIDLLSKLQERNFKHHSRCTYLYRERGQIKCSDVNDHQLGELVSDLKQEIFKEAKQYSQRISVWTEDAETVLFLEHIAKKELLSQLTIERKYKFGMNELLNLVERGIPVFKDALIVLDGDARKVIKNKSVKNLVLLPTDIRPENLIYDFLLKLPECDEFWQGVAGYSKEYFLGNKPSTLNDRVVMKAWFNEHLQHWGKKGALIFKRWAEDNTHLTEKFNNELETALSKLLR
jgi:AAA15 family ATPase/GTPase